MVGPGERAHGILVCPSDDFVLVPTTTDYRTRQRNCGNEIPVSRDMKLVRLSLIPVSRDMQLVRLSVCYFAFLNDEFTATSPCNMSTEN